MASCPKCGVHIKKKKKSSGVRECRRHGPISNLDRNGKMIIPPETCALLPKNGLSAFVAGRPHH